MERRRFIALMGASVSASTAGCSDAIGPIGGEASANENRDLPDLQEVRSRDQGENILEAGTLQITEHELVVNELEDSTEVWLEGVVENTSDEFYDKVVVTARFYDNARNLLRTESTWASDIEGGRTWNFDIFVLEDPEDIETYDMGLVAKQF